MILKIKYEDLTSTAARGEVDGKLVNFYLRIEVNELNLLEALDRFRGNKWVVGYDFVGEVGYLNTVDIGDSVVMVSRDLDNLDMNLDFIMSEINDKVRVLINLPKDFKDMKAVYTFSQKYKNTRYSGGKLIKLDGCNVGFITADDIPKKIAESRIPVVTEGSACIFPSIDMDDVDSLEFYENKVTTLVKKVRSPKTHSEKASKPKSSKKSLPSILALGKFGGTDNF